MEREIKFRGKCVFTGEWLHGGLIQIENSTRICWFNEQDVFCSAAIKKETLTQYTGLKDKNGREIYEWDIVFCQSGYHKYKTVVKIGEYLQDGSGNEYASIKCYGVYGLESQCSHGRYVPQSSINENESVEVIGNIYENPELLEGML